MPVLFAYMKTTCVCVSEFPLQATDTAGPGSTPAPLVDVEALRVDGRHIKLMAGRVGPPHEHDVHGNAEGNGKDDKTHLKDARWMG